MWSELRQVQPLGSDAWMRSARGSCAGQAVWIAQQQPSPLLGRVAFDDLAMELWGGHARLVAVELIADALERLDHRGVPRLRWRGQVEACPALIAQWCSGEPCAGPGPELLFELLRQALSLLAHAHARGVVHRGLRPERLLWHAPSGRLSVVGWRDVAVDGRGRPGPVGSPPPELLCAPRRALLASPALDIHALGCSLVALATGRPMPTARQLLLEEPVREGPEALAGLLRTMRARDPADRPRADEALAGLRRSWAAPPPRAPGPRELLAAGEPGEVLALAADPELCERALQALGQRPGPGAGAQAVAARRHAVAGELEAALTCAMRAWDEETAAGEEAVAAVLRWALQRRVPLGEAEVWAVLAVGAARLALVEAEAEALSALAAAACAASGPEPPLRVLAAGVVGDPGCRPWSVALWARALRPTTRLAPTRGPRASRVLAALCLGDADAALQLAGDGCLAAWVELVDGRPEEALRHLEEVGEAAGAVLRCAALLALDRVEDAASVLRIGPPPWPTLAAQVALARGRAPRSWQEVDPDVRPAGGAEPCPGS